MGEHLAFMKRYKALLGLSLNATEDLLVNGARPPSDRGVCKHLLSKVDRKLVERVLAKEAVRADAPLRARLLAGVVRIDADPGLLLFYLEALAALRDKRDAAAAFGLTVDRIDFGALSNAQIGQLLEVVVRTFEGHDRAQALYGLLASASFERAFARALPALPAPLAGVFGPISAAKRVILDGQAATSDAERALARSGAEQLLAEPRAVLASYPEEVRRRLAAWAIDLDPSDTRDRVAGELVQGLERGAPETQRLALALVDRHIVAGRDDAARKLANEILQAEPTQARAKRRLAALSWPRAGRLALQPGAPPSARFVRAFWLDRALLVWARSCPPSAKERLARETALQRAQALPGVAAVVGEGTTDDGSAYVLLATEGRPLDARQMSRGTRLDALTLVTEQARVLRALGLAGVAIEDADPARWSVVPGSARAATLVDFSGASRQDSTLCLARHALLVRELGEALLGAPALREEPRVAEALARATLDQQIAGLVDAGLVLAEHLG